MKIISVSNPRWSNSAQTTAMADVTFESIGLVPFTASPFDVEAHGRAIFSSISAGEYGAIAPFIPPALTQVKAEKLKQLEAARKSSISTLPPVTVAGKQFPADSEYQGVISNLSRRLAAARPLPATVRGVDGVVVTLNSSLLNQLDDALSAAVQVQWDKYWLRFEAVQAATTNAAVEAVTW